MLILLIGMYTVCIAQITLFFWIFRATEIICQQRGFRLQVFFFCCCFKIQYISHNDSWMMSSPISTGIVTISNYPFWGLFKVIQTLRYKNHTTPIRYIKLLHQKIFMDLSLHESFRSHNHAYLKRTFNKLI